VVQIRPRDVEAFTMTDSLLEFSEANWNSEVEESPIPVLVDFWAPWCGPCRRLAPTIEKLAEEYQGRAKIGKLDTDNNSDIAARFQISSIPTVLVFKPGSKMPERVAGAQSESTYRKMLEAAGA